VTLHSSPSPPLPPGRAVAGLPGRLSRGQRPSSPWLRPRVTSSLLCGTRWRWPSRCGAGPGGTVGQGTPLRPPQGGAHSRTSGPLPSTGNSHLPLVGTTGPWPPPPWPPPPAGTPPWSS
jgi:hypothetical protein